MIATTTRVVAAIAGGLVLILSFAPSPTLLSDASEDPAMLPPCDVEPGTIPFLQEDEVTCYWGMSEEIVTLPGAVDTVDVSVDVSWEEEGVWVGIAHASEANKCTLREGYYECPQDGVDLLAGGPTSDRGFVWRAISGDLRFVVGGEDSQSMQQFDVAWSYEASLPGPQAGSWWVIAIGVALLIYAVIGPRRALSLIEDALVGFPF